MQLLLQHVHYHPKVLDANTGTSVKVSKNFGTGGVVHIIDVAGSLIQTLAIYAYFKFIHNVGK